MRRSHWRYPSRWVLRPAVAAKVGRLSRAKHADADNEKLVRLTEIPVFTEKSVNRKKIRFSQ